MSEQGWGGLPFRVSFLKGWAVLLFAVSAGTAHTPKNLSPGAAPRAGSFQLSAIPMREIRARVISALAKIQQRLLRRL